MESDDPGGAAALRWTDSGWTDSGWTDSGWPATHASDHAAVAVTALYQDHAMSLIRLAYLMLGDRAAAEDAVQDAFCGLYRHWDRLDDPGRALGYVRTAVLNGCRSALRRRTADRQREALVLRFYLDLPEREIARVMGLRPGSVRSATHRALRALGQSLKEA
jgi:DNA-directed RNA polymerase specialized sigma24 family protein